LDSPLPEGLFLKKKVVGFGCRESLLCCRTTELQLLLGELAEVY